MQIPGCTHLSRRLEMKVRAVLSVEPTELERSKSFAIKPDTPNPMLVLSMV